MAYRTEQKELLTAYLRLHPDRQFTVGELVEELSGGGAIGTSTVYRLMNRLTEEGVVRRFMVGRTVYYQATKGSACRMHLHLKCTSCGGMLHLSSAVSEFLYRQIEASNRFQLDGNATLLFGTCATCQKEIQR